MDAPGPSSPSPSERSMSASSTLPPYPEPFAVLNKPCMISSTSKSQFNQVIFHDLQEIYPCDSDIRCSYSLTDDIQPQPGDKVSLFKVGWNSVSEYIAFIRPNMNMYEGRTMQITFPAADLPKNPGDGMYQFCYISSGNVVAGASIPFSFHKPHESELVAIEDPSDPSLIVFKSRAGQLQDQLYLKSLECEGLTLDNALKGEKLEVLRRKLADSDSRVASLLDEVQRLKSEVSARKANEQSAMDENRAREEAFEELQKEVAKSQNEVVRLKRLKNIEEHELKSVKSLEYEVNQATQAAQELKAELQIKLLAIENMTKDNERLGKQNAELELKLKQAVLMQNQAVSEKVELRNELDKAENVIRDLSRRVEETRAFILDIQSSGTADERQSKMIDLEDRLLVCNIQLQDLKEVHGVCATQIRDLKEEIQLMRENHELEVVQLVSDKVDCQERIQSLLMEANNKKSPSLTDPLNDVYEAVKRTLSFGDSKPQASSAPASGALESKLQKTLEKKTELQKELVLARHERDEIDACLKTAAEENASLKSRISVLEVELTALKKDAGVYKGRGASLSGAVEAFNRNIAAIEKFNQIVDEGHQWKAKFEAEKQEASSLRTKVEDLLLKESQLCDEVARLKREESAENESSPRVSSSMKEAEILVEFMRKQKSALEAQLIEARKALVGKVSVESCQKILEENAQLKTELTKERETSLCLKTFVFDSFQSFSSETTCPLCAAIFHHEDFARHFASHI